jgi:HSP20 family protein
MIEITQWQRPTLAEWPTVDSLFGLRDELGRLFETQLDALNQGSQSRRLWNPAMDIFEDPNNLFVRAEVPGLKKEEIEVALENGELSISGERKSTTNPAEAKTHRAERFVGRFQRTIFLPAEVQADKVAAHYQDGVLTVTLPKAEAAKPKQIKVETN